MSRTLLVAMGLAVFLIAMPLGLAGCGKRESRYVQSAGDSASRVADSSEAGPDTPPAPAQGASVGRNDSLINAIAPRLAPWLAMWREAMPGFTPDSLYRVGAAPAFRKGYVQPLKNVYPPPAEREPVFLILSAHSPDGRYNLIFDWYQHIGDSSGDVEIGGEPDSAPLLLDLRGGVSNQFDACGTGCGFHWGVWLSPTRFALAGWHDADPTGRWKQGSLKIYSIADSSSTAYVTRPVSRPKFAQYRAAWKDWVASKFRGLKPATTRS